MLRGSGCFGPYAAPTGSAATPRRLRPGVIRESYLLSVRKGSGGFVVRGAGCLSTGPHDVYAPAVLKMLGLFNAGQKVHEAKR